MGLLLAAWFFFLWTHQTPVVGPFKSRAECERIRAEVVRIGDAAPRVSSCWEGS